MAQKTLNNMPVDDSGDPTTSVTGLQGKYGPEAGQRPFYAVASKRGIKGGPKKIPQATRKQAVRKTVSKSM